jgi:DNA-binding NarL/FixJ family response regulator
MAIVGWRRTFPLLRTLLMLRILIADDHEVVCRGLRNLLHVHAGWNVCAEATGGQDAVSCARQLLPDVAILDVEMPDLDGLAATRLMREVSPGTEICVFTMHDTEDVVADVVAAGARGYVLKTDPPRHVLAAVEALSRHGSFLTPSVADAVAARFRRGARKGGPSGASPLTVREREVVRLLASGQGNKAVAQALVISVKTVESHRASVMRKLEIDSLVELVRYAIRNKLVAA